MSKNASKKRSSKRAKYVRRGMDRIEDAQGRSATYEERAKLQDEAEERFGVVLPPALANLSRVY